MFNPQGVHKILMRATYVAEPLRTLYIILVYQVIRHMFRLPMNQSSGCTHKMKDTILTIVMLKYIKIYLKLRKC
jgi:hypothetical protein